MSDLVLSLFPGIGLLDMAFEEAGFCVVRGPDLLWGGDVKAFHPPAGHFAGVIGGPPCQAHSRLRFIVRHNGYQVAEDLIPEFQRCVVEAAPAWWLMENVPDAPLPVVAGYKTHSFLFDNHWTGAEQGRIRRFSFGTPSGQPLHPEIAALCLPVRARAVMASGNAREVPVAMMRTADGRLRRKTSILNNMGHPSAKSLPRAIELQGLPPDFLADAPFTVAGKVRVIGNGVPLPTGRAIAHAVRKALS